MNGNQKIGVALAVLAALGGVAYLQTEKDKKIGTSETTSEQLPDVKLASSDDVTKISLTNGDKPEIVLEKVGDKWELKKPLSAPVNQAHVKSLFENLKELKAHDLISKEINDDLKKTYDLGADKAVHIALYKGENKTFDASFGKSGGRGQMAVIDGKPGIYGLKNYSSSYYTREVKNWRDNEIFKFDDNAVSQVTIVKKDGTVSLSKASDKWTGTYKGAPIERFDADKTKQLLGAFKGLTAEDFGDGKSATDTGLDAPDAVVTIQLKDGGAKFVLKVGKTASGSTRYAQRDGDSTIFVISGWAGDWATDLSKLQVPADAGAPKKDGGK